MGRIRLKIQSFLDEEMLERIHNLALEVLRKCGMKVSNERAIRELPGMPQVFERSMLQQWLPQGKDQKERVKEVIKERISSHDFVLQEDKKKALDKIYQCACKKLGRK